MSQIHEQPQDFVTPQQAAHALGVSKATVLRWIHTGYLKAYRVGPRLIHIPASELEHLGREV